MPRQIPKPVEELWKRYPTVWKAFNELGSRCREAGPLDEKCRRLVKLALRLARAWRELLTPPFGMPRVSESSRKRLIMWHC